MVPIHYLCVMEPVIDEDVVVEKKIEKCFQIDYLLRFFLSLKSLQ